MTHNRCIDCRETVVKRRPIDRPISKSVLKKVDKIWDDHFQASQGKAFNGQVFCVDQFDGQLITGDFIEYKYLIAQLATPDLFQHLQITSLAVTGLLHWHSKVLLGFRNKNVAQNKHQWELAPAGGVDQCALLPDGTIDLAKALNEEALEEIGFNLNECPEKPTPKLIIHDQTEHVVDIVLFLELNFDQYGISSKMVNYANDEYDQLGIYTLPELLTPNSSINLSNLTKECLTHIEAFPDKFGFQST